MIFGVSRSPETEATARIGSRWRMMQSVAVYLR